MANLGDGGSGLEHGMCGEESSHHQARCGTPKGCKESRGCAGNGNPTQESRRENFDSGFLTEEEKINSRPQTYGHKGQIHR